MWRNKVYQFLIKSTEKCNMFQQIQHFGYRKTYWDKFVTVFEEHVFVVWKNRI